MKKNPLEQKIITNIKTLSIDMINNAQSGHPGIVLGAAPIIYTLFAKHLNINTIDSNWVNKDRFVLSAGHGSALLYSVLFMAGYDLSLDDLKGFRQVDSKTPGYPEINKSIGVDLSSGVYGQGLATAVGMALAERYMAAHFNSNEKGAPKLFDNYTYVMCTDGELMEGITFEACSFAATQKLSKLIVLCDSNDIVEDGSIKEVSQEDLSFRFSAMGWHTQIVKNGEDVVAIDKAIEKAKRYDSKPSLIIVKTIIGNGSLKQGTNEVHSNPLDENDYEQIKTKLGLRIVPFSVSKEAAEEFRRQMAVHCGPKYSEWSKAYNTLMNSQNEQLKNEYNLLMTGDSISLLDVSFDYSAFDNLPFTDVNYNVINSISNKLYNFIGGTADYRVSSNIFLEGQDFISTLKPQGKNIAFGMRESAMGAIMNGIATYGIRTFGGTKLVLADNLKPSIRMSSIMNLPCTYIFADDSVENGADGPFFQPIEQLPMLRSIPNCNVYRPCDAKELVGSWNCILSSNSPSALVLSKQGLPVYENSSLENVSKGAYVLKKEKGQLHGIIIATGAEVKTAMVVSEALETRNINLRVVSMPCMENFLEQSEEYRKQVLPVGYKTFVLEASSSFGWHKFVYNEKYLFTLDTFGCSGKGEDVLHKYELTPKDILVKIMNLLQ